MSSYLITGAGRGLGLEMVRELASQPSSITSHVFATSRSPNPSDELGQIISTSSNRVHYVSLNVADPTSITAAVQQVSDIAGTSGLDVLINNAGIIEPEMQSKIEGTPSAHFQAVLTTNVIGTHEVSQAFLPLLRKGKDKKILNIGSGLGIFAQAREPRNKLVPLPAYKVSKAACHMLTLQWAQSLEEEGFCVQALAPGKNDTAASKDVPVENDLTPDQGAKAIIEVVQNSRLDDNGRFRAIKVKGWESKYGVSGPYDGKDLPW